MAGGSYEGQEGTFGSKKPGEQDRSLGYTKESLHFSASY